MVLGGHDGYVMHQFGGGVGEIERRQREGEEANGLGELVDIDDDAVAFGGPYSSNAGAVGGCGYDIRPGGGRCLRHREQHRSSRPR